jgi:hypothetical protein
LGLVWAASDRCSPSQFTNPEGIDEDCFEVIRETLQVEQDKRPTSVQLEEFAFISGPKEKLVLQHCEFKIESRVQSPVKWLQDLKNELKDVNVIVQEKRTGSEEGIDEEEHVDATVRTVEADEDEIRGHMGMRSISVHVLRCVHETQNVVFKVTVTMMSPDAGQQNPYPVVAFDLQVGASISPAQFVASRLFFKKSSLSSRFPPAQSSLSRLPISIVPLLHFCWTLLGILMSCLKRTGMSQSGEASIFQHIFRKIRVRYMHFLNKDASKMVLTRQVSLYFSVLASLPSIAEAASPALDPKP